MTDEQLEKMIMRCLVLGITSYECDEPRQGYGFTDDGSYPFIPYSEMVRNLQSEHCGDCVKIPCSCMRCHAEHVFHKAEFLTNKIIKHINKTSQGRDDEIVSDKKPKG